MRVTLFVYIRKYSVGVQFEYPDDLDIDHFIGVVARTFYSIFEFSFWRAELHMSVSVYHFDVSYSGDYVPEGGEFSLHDLRKTLNVLELQNILAIVNFFRVEGYCRRYNGILNCFRAWGGDVSHI